MNQTAHFRIVGFISNPDETSFVNIGVVAFIRFIIYSDNYLFTKALFTTLSITLSCISTVDEFEISGYPKIRNGEKMR